MIQIKRDEREICSNRMERNFKIDVDWWKDAGYSFSLLSLSECQAQDYDEMSSGLHNAVTWDALRSF